jgi:hypothetical protein
MTDTLAFDAVLVGDFAGGRAGDMVNVHLNLIGPGLSGGSLWLKRAGAADSALIWLPVEFGDGTCFL